MKRITSILYILLLTTATGVMAQDNRPYKGIFYNKENDLRIVIDLYDTTVVAPAYSFLGRMHGYLTGRLHDMWFITNCILKDGKAYVEFTNDLGADSQDVVFSLTDDGNLNYNAQGTNYIRRAENGHWVKLPTEMVFVRRKLPLKNGNNTKNQQK